MVPFLDVVLLAGPDSFVKTTNSANGIYTLQTAAHRLTAIGKPDVWLIGVAHVGEKAYYAELQKLLNAQDEVLFEGVKSDKAPPKPKTTRGAAKPAKSIYQVLGDALGLDFQLTDIDYGHKNWIDSDLTMEQLEKLNAKASGGKPNQFSMIEKLMDPTSPMAQAFASEIHAMTPGTLAGLKLGLVEKLSTVDPTQELFDPATTKVLLTERNASVEKYFARALDGRMPPKSIGIFYGALHQQDLEHALTAKYGYKVVDKRWFTAATADTRKIGAQGKMLLNLLTAPPAPVRNLNSPSREK